MIDRFKKLIGLLIYNNYNFSFYQREDRICIAGIDTDINQFSKYNTSWMVITSIINKKIYAYYKRDGQYTLSTGIDKRSAEEIFEEISDIEDLLNLPF